MYSIGVDIGGMSIKVGLVEDGKIVASNREKTVGTPKQCIDNLINQIYKVLDEKGLTIKDVKGIGIGCPGSVIAEKCMVDYLPNLKWDTVPIGDMLKKHFDTRIEISNDANVAALGEALYGCAKDYDTVVMFTLGTGVGGGIIINKKLFEGGWSRGAELGHTTLVLNGEPCTCGRNGCVENYVSASALILNTKKTMLSDPDSLMWKVVDGDINKVDGRTAFECEKKGDKAATKVIEKYIMYLSESIMNMLNIFRPNAFIIGGGVSMEGENLIKRVKAYLEKFDYGYKRAPRSDILIAALGNDAGIIGASALVI